MQQFNMVLIDHDRKFKMFNHNTFHEYIHDVE